jgi:hypothetical protein
MFPIRKFRIIASHLDDRFEEPSERYVTLRDGERILGLKANVLLACTKQLLELRKSGERTGDFLTVQLAESHIPTYLVSESYLKDACEMKDLEFDSDLENLLEANSNSFAVMDFKDETITEKDKIAFGVEIEGKQYIALKSVENITGVSDYNVTKALRNSSENEIIKIQCGGRERRMISIDVARELFDLNTGGYTVLNVQRGFYKQSSNDL